MIVGATNNRGMNLILVGLRGCGKSTLGAKLAPLLKLTFLDLDHEVEKQTGRSIAEIFSKEGEPMFRKLESRALYDLAGRERLLLATGGGIVLSQKNRDFLRKLGIVVWLRVSAEHAIQRMHIKTHRPPLTDLSPLAEVRLLARQREWMYVQVADHAVDTNDRSIEQVCDELQKLWRSLSGDDLWCENPCGPNSHLE